MTNRIKITDPLDVMPVLVNEIVTSGFLNGIVNIKFATARWTPGEPDETGYVEVDPDLMVSADLRMDLHLAQRVRDRLDAIIQAHTKPARATEH